jgi:hypothetical protein
MAITTPRGTIRRPLLIAILLCLSIPAPPAIAEPPSAEGEIRIALERWTSDFNAGQSDKVCGKPAKRPGDVLVTDTPSGVGQATYPETARWLA